MIGVRVEVVPDNDEDADPRIPKDVLAALTPETTLIGLRMMYVRQSLWEKIKEIVPVAQTR